jgi:predicted nucleic acid-binding protein
MTPLLLDTSSWVEYLRDSGSPSCERVDELIRNNSVLATTDIVIMELLAGAREPDDRKKIWAFLNRCVMLPVRPLFEYEKAAELYRRCRSNGFTPANTNDLLVASVAIGKKVPLLAADADFEQIASVSSLKLVA